jgi:hypothetical protein
VCGGCWSVWGGHKTDTLCRLRRPDRLLGHFDARLQPCAGSYGPVAESVDEKRDHALAVGDSLVMRGLAEVGDGTQEVLWGRCRFGSQRWLSRPRAVPRARVLVAQRRPSSAPTSAAAPPGGHCEAPASSPLGLASGSCRRCSDQQMPGVPRACWCGSGHAGRDSGLDAIATRGFGRVERTICLAHQLLGLAGVIGKDGNAEAGRQRSDL